VKEHGSKHKAAEIIGQLRSTDVNRYLAERKNERQCTEGHLINNTHTHTHRHTHRSINSW